MRGVLATSTILGGYFGYTHIVRKGFTPDPTFPNGSMDQVVMDKLDTGDLIAFNRKCTWMKVIYRQEMKYIYIYSLLGHLYVPCENSFLNPDSTIML